jgi:SAM-dependent methyltransferase
MIGWTRYFGRHWPLMARTPARAVPDAAISAQDAEPVDLTSIARFRQSLHATLEWWMSAAMPPAHTSRKGAWGGYTQDRMHYLGDSIERKRAQVEKWLTHTQPAWVADLGCNTGEFSRMALNRGAQVIAIDGDHDSIQKLFMSSTDAGLHSVIAILDDMKGGAGWLGEESPGLMARLNQSVDLVLMLALVHHLAVAASMPLDAVAQMARRLSRGWLIVEFVGPEDPQMRLLCAQRQRDPQEFSIDRQKTAFLEAGFELRSQLELAPTHRMLALMKTLN